MSFASFFGPLSHTGRVWVFGHHVSVDAIHPARFFSLDPERAAQGLFQGVDPAMPEPLRPGDVVVAGRNFGCGSSREVYAVAMLRQGIAAVVAASIARICQRNLANHGILALEGLDLTDQLRSGEQLTIDLAAGQMRGASAVWPIPQPPTADFLELLRVNSLRKGQS